MERIITIALLVFFSLPVLALILGYRPYQDSTRQEDPRRDEQVVEYANAALVHELGNAEGTPRYAASSSSEEAPESEQEPTPRPLSPWLDDSQ